MMSQVFRPPLSTGNHGFLNGGYWPSWAYYQGITPSSIPHDRISHIIYAFADIDGDGTVYLADEKVHFKAEVDGTNGCVRAWTKRKLENQDLKITLAIGGGGADTAKKYSDVTGDRRKLFTFIQSVTNLVDQFQLDGVDIDWEYPSGKAEASQYLQLLTELRRALGWHRWVTTALPAGKWVLKTLDLAQISEVVDFINLMAYDFVGPTFGSTNRTGHHAQLYRVDGDAASGDDAVQYLLEQGVPSRKITLGVPVYGRTFKGADGPNQGFDGPGSGNEATYETKVLPQPGTVEIFDSASVAAYAKGNGEYVTYDNVDCVRMKAEYVKRHNLRGLFYWHLAGDRQGDASLVRCGHDALVNTDANHLRHA